MNKKRLLRLGWPWLILLWACQVPFLSIAQATPTPTPGTPSGIQVQEIQVQIMESMPVQVRAVLRGLLPNPCTVFADMNVTRQGNVFLIQLETSITSPTCPSTPTPFEVAVPLPVTGLPGGTYSIVAHGANTTFTLPEGVTGPLTTPSGPTDTTPIPIDTPSSPMTPSAAKGRIMGLVWEDRCDFRGGEGGEPLEVGSNCRYYDGKGFAGDGIRQTDEPPLVGVLVELRKGPCPGTPVGTTSTDEKGQFLFDGLEPGTYCVSVNEGAPVNASILIPGAWTKPAPDQGLLTVELGAGATVTVDFGRTLNAFGFLPAVTPEPTSPPSGAMLPDLGEPEMRDPMDNPRAKWYMVDDPQARFEASGGRLIMYGYDLSYTNYWGLSAYPALTDAYLEGVFITGPDCRGRDRYGFIVRAPSPQFGIVVLISCGGEFLIFRWDGEYNVLQNWTRSNAINTGPNQTNRLGIWMEGNTLKLYINRRLVAQVTDNVYTQGRFGLVIGAYETSGFWVAVDEVAYWRLP